MSFLSLFVFFLFSSVLASPLPQSCDSSSTSSTGLTTDAAPTSTSSAPSSSPLPTLPPCFPSLDFEMPSTIPSSLDNWWCSMDTEYAFMGFSYEITSCPSSSQLNAEFADIRSNFNGRYIRIYGVCDNAEFYDDVIDAAWNNGLGVHALIWFGYDDGNEWQTRRDSLVNTLTTNPKAKFITRGLQFGSEPLYDNALPHFELASQVTAVKAQLSAVKIPVTVSELAYGYQMRGGAQDVLDAVDYINIHMLPFFSSLATTAELAWPLVEIDMNWFIQNGNGKKMYFDENGWPSVTSQGVQPNSLAAVASISNEHQYYQLLDRHCTDLKHAPGGGIGWFAHIYSDRQEPGYGIYNADGIKKFNFKPRTSC